MLVVVTFATYVDKKEPGLAVAPVQKDATGAATELITVGSNPE
jgi:hypothetical protein